MSPGRTRSINAETASRTVRPSPPTVWSTGMLQRTGWRASWLKLLACTASSDPRGGLAEGPLAQLRTVQLLRRGRGHGRIVVPGALVVHVPTIRLRSDHPCPAPYVSAVDRSPPGPAPPTTTEDHRRAHHPGAPEAPGGRGGLRLPAPGGRGNQDPLSVRRPESDVRELEQVRTVCSGRHTLQRSTTRLLHRKARGARGGSVPTVQSVAS